MNAKPNYDYGYIRVEPNGAGVFGNMSFSGSHYDNDSHLKDMVEEIERHVDRVRVAYIEYDYYRCSVCNSNYESENEADNCCVTKEELLELDRKEV